MTAGAQLLLGKEPPVASKSRRRDPARRARGEEVKRLWAAHHVERMAPEEFREFCRRVAAGEVRA